GAGVVAAFRPRLVIPPPDPGRCPPGAAAVHVLIGETGEDALGRLLHEHGSRADDLGGGDVLALLAFHQPTSSRPAQVATPCGYNLEIIVSNASEGASATLRGRPNKYPCTWLQPRCDSNSACASFSTPSATTGMPRSRHMLNTARTIASAPVSSSNGV